MYERIHLRVYERVVRSISMATQFGFGQKIHFRFFLTSEHQSTVPNAERYHNIIYTSKYWYFVQHACTAGFIQIEFVVHCSFVLLLTQEQTR